MKPANLLVLMSDEHNPKIMGASGHRIVKTPHLDALAARGHRVVSIGKLHFRGHPQDDNGFSEEIIPMNIIEGKGDLMGLLRSDLPERGLSWKIAKLAGAGETPYTAYDREIATRAEIWLREEAPRYRDKPWVLFVSFVCPHFPLVAPAEFYYRYPLSEMPLPKQYGRAERPEHPCLRDYAESFVYDRFFDEETVRKVMAAYYALCTFLDDNIYLP